MSGERVSSHVQEPTDPRLFGRDALVTRLARSQAPVTLLTGDSGMGKSSVLSATQRASGTSAIAPAPRTLARGGAVLQNALLESLADAVAILIQDKSTAARIASVLADGAKRLAEDRGQELAKVVGRELLNLVRGRLGEEVGSALGDYISQLKTSVDEQMSSRITAAIDPGVVGLIIALAEEVCGVAGDEPVFLALDSAERLGGEDAAILADLAESLPSALRLRVALSTYDAAQRKKTDYLDSETAATAVIEVAPLELTAIEEWLIAEDLEGSYAR
ncbi:MAG TPA: AAA family ATPase [Solirubrobacterales bacterium]|nr:AAA family ATPase [Solirubrobacterales bacterium]